MAGKRTQPLISSRYAVMYLPNTEWNYMDAIGKSDQTKAAFKNNEISTKGKNINKYLELTATERLRKLRESQKSTTPQPPDHILQLLKLQAERGKFECLADVLKCLFMPPDVKFRHDKMFAEWEKATAFAIAAIRQQNEYFDYLCTAHDKAFAWMESNEILFEARELLNAYQFTTVESAQPTMHEGSQQDLSTAPEENTSEHNSMSSPSVSQGPSIYSNNEGAVTDELAMGMTGGGSTQTSNNQAVFTLSTAQLAQAFQGLHTIEELADDMSAATAEHSEADSDIGADEQLAAEEQRLSMRPLSPSFGALQEKLAQLTVGRDEGKIRAQQEVVNRLQLEVISLCIEIEKLVHEVHIVAQRCIRNYSDCETRNQRFKQFEELTAMLGDGRPPAVGFTDWRARGVVGVRPTMMKFLLAVQAMADARLTLQELEQPGGRALGAKLNMEANLSRWKLLWNGHDVVHKVLHCLDFLRKCRELSEWYGPSFYFVANPLVLPFPLYPTCCAEGASVDMAAKVLDQQRSAPHLRLGTAQPSLKAEWEHQQYLNKWRRQFQEAAECWAFNWPLVPDIRVDPAHEQLFDALLVLCITCQATLQKSYLWEKKFIAQIHSVRGQDRLLIGNNTSKVDKKLEIPPATARRPRPLDPLRADQRGRASDLDASTRRRSSTLGFHRRASTTSTTSFAPFGYSLVESSQSQSPSEGIFEFSQDEEGEKSDPEGSPQVRSNLAKALQFTKLVKTAEEKAALLAQQQLAQMRKASVLNRKTMSPNGKRGTVLSRARSPSMALGGSRRPSSRPSISAGAGDSAGGMEGYDATTPGKHSMLRKASTISATGMPRQSSRKHSTALSSAQPAADSPGAQRTSSANARGSILMHSPLRKSSTASGVLTTPGPGGGSFLRKSSTASALNSSPSRSDTVLERRQSAMAAGVTGKFSGPQAGQSKPGAVSRLNSSAAIFEEGSFDSEGFGGEETPHAAVESGINSNNNRSPPKAKKGSIAEPVSAVGGGAEKRGSVLCKSSTAPLLGRITEGPKEGEKGTSRKGSALPAVGEGRASTVTASLSVKVPAPGAGAVGQSASSKGPRLSLLHPADTDGSVGSHDSHDKAGGAKKKKRRKKSTAMNAAALAEGSLDNTTVSMALVSPPQSPPQRKHSRKPSTAPGRAPASGDNAGSGPDSSDDRNALKSANRKKRGSTLLAERVVATTSNVVTRLPPVQSNVRLTRRKDSLS